MAKKAGQKKIYDILTKIRQPSATWNQMVNCWKDYCDALIKLQEGKNVFRRAFGSWTKGVSGFVTATRWFKFGKIGLIRYMTRAYKAYTDADDEDQDILDGGSPSDETFEDAIAQTLSEYASQTITLFDKWIEEKKELIFKEDSATYNVLSQYIKGKRGKDQKLCLRLFPDALDYWSDLTDVQKIDEQEKNYLSWKKNLNTNLKNDNINQDTLDIINDKKYEKIRKKVQADATDTNDDGKRTNKTRSKRRGALTDNELETQPEISEQIEDKLEDQKTLGLKQTPESFAPQILKIKDVESKGFMRILKGTKI